MVDSIAHVPKFETWISMFVSSIPFPMNSSLNPKPHKFRLIISCSEKRGLLDSLPISSMIFQPKKHSFSRIGLWFSHDFPADQTTPRSVLMPPQLQVRLRWPTGQGPNWLAEGTRLHGLQALGKPVRFHMFSLEHCRCVCIIYIYIYIYICVCVYIFFIYISVYI